MVTQGLPPEELVRIIGLVGPGVRGAWTRRMQVVALFGSYDEGAEVSARDIEALDLYSRGWACRVLRELREADVLERVWAAGGRRAAAYRVNPTITEWKVPWLGGRPTRALAVLSHVEPTGDLERRPVSRSERGYRDTVRTRVALYGGSARHGDEDSNPRRAEGALNATRGSARVAVSGGSARHGATGAQISSPVRSGSSTHADGGSGSAAAAGSKPLEVRRVEATVEAWVKKRIKVPFFRGANRDQLVELHGAVGAEALYDAILTHEPDPKKNPTLRILDLVDDVTATVLAPHDERAQALVDAPDAEPAPTPPAEPEQPSRYREFRADPSAEALNRERSVLALEQARAARLQPLRSDQEVQEA